ncbi:ABC transporter permease [Catenulispora subtropica]|uniref:ABC transporter permease n=1 Tax=Catenulispora subtropica TaxID=450798 RepID=A0ABP5DN11_9ACTN
MTNLLRAEWIKIRSLRSFVAGLLLGALGVLSCNVNAVIADRSPHRGVRLLGGGGVFTNDAHIVVLYLFGSIGAMVMVSEYGSGLIRTTFTAVPARTEVLAAKAIVVAAVTAFAGLVTYVVSLIVTLILAGQHRFPSVLLHDADFHRAMAASILLFPLSALTGLGVGVVVRHTATTIVAVSVLLVLLPTFVTSQKRAWVNDLHNATPFAAWQRLTLGRLNGWRPGDGGFANPTIGGSWLVYLLWPSIALLLALLAIRRRDV